jgi:5'-methylthioadenosine phosphorylase
MDWTMIALISEGRNSFVTHPERFGGIHLTEHEASTPFGSIRYLEVEPADGPRFLYFAEGGTSTTVGVVEAPLAIFHLLQTEAVQRVVMIGKVGGVNPLLTVGDLLVPDDYFDFTVHRKRSYWQALDPNLSLHYVMERPFCDRLGASTLRALHEVKEMFPDLATNIFERGRYFCTEGPAFESGAEISAFRQLGADVVGHSLLPGAYYARELGICMSAICLVSNQAQAYGSTATQPPFPHSEQADSLLSQLFLSAAKWGSGAWECTCNRDPGLWLRNPVRRGRFAHD